VTHRANSNSGTLTPLAAGSPSVTVGTLSIDHFKVAAAGGGAIGNQQVGVPFNISITAQDVNNNTINGFTGTVDITSNRTISGGNFTTGNFVNGVLASQAITLTQAGTGSTITATQHGGSASGSSNTFTVFGTDGAGTISLNKTWVRYGSPGNALTFMYTAPAGGMNNGAIALTVPAGWSAPSTTGTDPGYVKVNIGTVTIQPDGRTILVSGVTRSEGQGVEIVYGSGALGSPGATAPSSGGSQTWTTQQKTLAGGTLTDLGSSPSLNVLEADGAGTMTPSTSTVAQTSAGNTITFTYTAANGGMVNGQLMLTVPSGWSYPSTTGSAAGYVTASQGTVTVGGGGVIQLTGINLNGGDTLTITYGSKASGGPGATAPSTTGPQTWSVTHRANINNGTLAPLATGSPVITVGS
jgi:hypothetical protein